MVEGNKSNTRSFWLFFVIAITYFLKEGVKIFDFNSIDATNLEKKTKMLNRVRNYMNPAEQDIIYKAEMIIHMMKTLKELSLAPNFKDAETMYTTLSFGDRKRQMMMDISEFLSSDSKKNVDIAMNIYEKANKFGSKFQAIKENSNEEINIDTIEGYVELIDPLVDEGLREKVKDLKKVFNMLRTMKLFDKKNNINDFNDGDIFKMIEPFVDEDQKEMAHKFIQIFKAVSSMDNKETSDAKPDEIDEETDEIDEETDEIDEETDGIKEESGNLL
ncbi:MAG: hypothetical protein LR001_02175 [Clostridiales bacterium]|nr:hypothetical protein [Clostridiales bacterium]